MPDTSRMYIRADDYMAKVRLGIPFEGYVIGWGKAYIRKAVIMPGNQNGYNPVACEHWEDTCCKSLSIQEIDQSAEMVRQSWEGAAVNGEVVHTVQPEENLKFISQLYNTTEENLRRLNGTENVQVGQRLVVFSRSADKNDDSMLQMLASGANVAALAGYAIPNLPENARTLDIYQRGRFTYEYKGKMHTAVNDFCYNKYCSEELVAAGKAKFMTNVGRLKFIGGMGTAASLVGAGISSNAVTKENANWVTYADATVGWTGVATDLATRFMGIEIPVVGEFIAYYGVCRITWDTFWEIGRQSGPLKMIHENIGYKGQEKRKKKELDKFNKYLLERLEREGY